MQHDGQHSRIGNAPWVEVGTEDNRQAPVLLWAHSPGRGCMTQRAAHLPNAINGVKQVCNTHSLILNPTQSNSNRSSAKRCWRWHRR